MPATLRRITIYPIKALDGVEVGDAAVLPSGALANDRRFALVDDQGHFVNGKRTAAVHHIRADFDLAAQTVKLRSVSASSDAQFSLADDQAAIGQWISAKLNLDCRLVENANAGFPDDTAAPGPTVVSTAALSEVASWFPGLSLDEARRRFRANLEIDGVPPFWEDRLVGPPGVEIVFAIGDVRWLGVNPCQRCVVPTRASETGDATPRFQKVFAERRKASLPPWADAARFEHFYRLAVNTRPASNAAGSRLQLGDAIRIG
jgi:uncharacterized protein YcbX